MAIKEIEERVLAYLFKVFIESEEVIHFFFIDVS